MALSVRGPSLGLLYELEAKAKRNNLEVEDMMLFNDTEGDHQMRIKCDVDGTRRT